MSDVECRNCGARHTAAPMDGCSECGGFVFENAESDQRIDTTPLTGRGLHAARADDDGDGVAVADDLTLDDYVALGEHVNEHHERPDACRCWGYEGEDCLATPTEPGGPCERLGFTEPAPKPDDEGESGDREGEPEVIADGGEESGTSPRGRIKEVRGQSAEHSGDIGQLRVAREQLDTAIPMAADGLAVESQVEVARDALDRYLDDGEVGAESGQ